MNKVVVGTLAVTVILATTLLVGCVDPKELLAYGVVPPVTTEAKEPIEDLYGPAPSEMEKTNGEISIPTLYGPQPT